MDIGKSGVDGESVQRIVDQGKSSEAGCVKDQLGPVPHAHIVMDPRRVHAIQMNVLLIEFGSLGMTGVSAQLIVKAEVRNAPGPVNLHKMVDSPAPVRDHGRHKPAMCSTVLLMGNGTPGWAGQIAQNLVELGNRAGKGLAMDHFIMAKAVPQMKMRKKRIAIHKNARLMVNGLAGVNGQHVPRLVRPVCKIEAANVTDHTMMEQHVHLARKWIQSPAFYANAQWMVNGMLGVSGVSAQVKLEHKEDKELAMVHSTVVQPVQMEAMKKVKIAQLMENGMTGASGQNAQ